MSARLSPAVILVAAAASGSCDPQVIGRPCELGVDVDRDAAVTSSGTTVIINAPALECPSRICLSGGTVSVPAGTGALCTASCNTDDDCVDGETAGGGAASGDPRCKTGFACAWPTTVGPYCCLKMCVCRDFAPEPQGGFPEPAVCRTPAGGCPNVH
jgi:hypothetical protein